MELLKSAGILFDSIAPELDESLRDELPPADRVLALSSDKAKAVASILSSTAPRLVLGADTLVCVTDGDGIELALGKPNNVAEARKMLCLLSGRGHVVRTGIAVLDRDSGKTTTARSDSIVRFARMSDDDIEAYLASGEWIGVAGGYRIQGLAACFVENLEGSWTGVVGLPMRELYVILHDALIRVHSFSI